MANIILVIIGILLICGGLASVFLSIIPSITNAVDETADFVVEEEPTKEQGVKAGKAIVWAIIVWILTMSLTLLAFIGGGVAIVIGVLD